MRRLFPRDIFIPLATTGAFAIAAAYLTCNWVAENAAREVPFVIARTAGAAQTLTGHEPAC